MLILRRFRDLIDAERSIEHLKSNGIDARVFLTAGISPIGYLVVIADRARRSEAELLLADLPDEPIEIEQSLEQLACPDLGALDPTLAPDCPACARVLPLDGEIAACPGCGAAVDVAELIALARGPETLSLCYPEPPHGIPQQLLDAASVCCPACGYQLSGLPSRGLCPECGQVYTKADILRGIV